VPFWLAYSAGLASEVIGRAIFLKRPPHITRYAVRLVGRPTRFSTARARDQLGWRPRVGAREGLRRALAWWESTGASSRPA
jgi:nucleoside-diphosphate-sugar epimerase